MILNTYFLTSRNLSTSIKFNMFQMTDIYKIYEHINIDSISVTMFRKSVRDTYVAANFSQANCESSCCRRY